jgi:disulfide bond formation protein DsbB
VRDTVIVFLALLAVVCQVYLVCWLGFVVYRLTGERGRAVVRTYRDVVAPLALPIAFAVASVTVLGSLYMSEVKHFRPCHLCWIQRAFLYPQPILLALLWWRPSSWPWVRYLAVVLLVADIPVSIWHYLIERYPSLESSVNVCAVDLPCTLVYVREFKYVSLPLMALTSALTVLTLLVTAWPKRSSTESV